MAGIVVGEGCLDILAAYNPSVIKVGLFASAHTVLNGDNLGTYTSIECSFPGYVQVTVAFGTPTFDGLGGEEMTLASAIYSSTGPSADFAFGYFVYNSVTGRLLGAEQFAPPGPYDMTVSGTTIVVDITLFEDPA